LLPRRDTATEPYARDCDGDLTLSADFQKGAVTTVFVKSIEPLLCTNDNQALTGTITLTVA